MRSLFIVIGLMLVLSGCASVPLSSRDFDEAGKSFKAAADKSNVYLFRNENFGAAALLTVTLNGKVMGQTAAKTYYLWELPPGEHEITSVGENVSSIKLKTAPGRSYYVWQEVKMGLFLPRSLLQEVDEETGQKGVGESQRAQGGVSY